MADLELSSNNPYARGFIVEYEDGTKTLERDTFTNPIRSIGDLTHIVADGDDLTQMAGVYYKDSQLWHKIANANPQLEDYFNLPVGMYLIIPNPATIENEYA